MSGDGKEVIKLFIYFIIVKILMRKIISIILRTLIFQKTSVHCLVYIHSLPEKKFGKEIFLLQQVDNFALGCDTPTVDEKMWTIIDKQMSAPLK